MDDWNAKPKSLKLTYFNAEGRAESLRLALILAGLEFDDNRIDFPTFLQEYKGKAPYGQLPLLTLNDTVTRAQSGALIRHIGRCWSTNAVLYPEEYLLDIEEVMGLVQDYLSSMTVWQQLGIYPETKFGYELGFSKTEAGKALIAKLQTEWYTNVFPQFMKYLSAWLEKIPDRKWLATPGSHPTIVDCVAVPALRVVTTGHLAPAIPATALNDYPVLTAYVKRFCALPGIQGRYTTGLH